MAAALLLPALACSACGERTATSPSQAPPPSTARTRLVDLGDFSLLAGRPTHTLFTVAKPHALRIFIIADRPLDSIELHRRADGEGQIITPELVPLQGSPHSLGRQTTYGLTSPSVEPGYYRLDLRGRGHVHSLAIQDW